MLARLLLTMKLALQVFAPTLVMPVRLPVAAQPDLPGVPMQVVEVILRHPPPDARR